MDVSETSLGKRIDHHDPKDKPTRGSHPHHRGQGEVVNQGGEENTQSKMLGAIYARHEHHVHTQQGQAKLDVKLELNSRLSFSVLTAATLHPTEQRQLKDYRTESHKELISIIMLESIIYKAPCKIKFC